MFKTKAAEAANLWVFVGMLEGDMELKNYLIQWKNTMMYLLLQTSVAM